MTIPAPRPALRKAADAHIHPAAPGGQRTLVAATVPTARLHRLSGPPSGNTSDSIRRVGRRSEPPRAAKVKKEKKVELVVKVPKSLKKDLAAAAKSAGRTPDQVVTSLIRAWIDN